MTIVEVVDIGKEEAKHVGTVVDISTDGKFVVDTFEVELGLGEIATDLR